MLNIYLVLSVATSMKADVFLVMTRFLCEHNQLNEVMIKQVQDLPNLSEEWALTKEERYSLYVECARLLRGVNDDDSAFRLLNEAARLVDVKAGGISADDNTKTASALVVSAIKSPMVLNFDEIMALTIVQELKSKAKEIYALIELFNEKDTDMKAFKASLATHEKTMTAEGIDKAAALLKKQYLQASTLSAGQVISLDDMAKLIGESAGDLDEWLVDAALHGVLEAHIDQASAQLSIKTTTLREVRDAEWQ